MFHDISISSIVLMGLSQAKVMTFNILSQIVLTYYVVITGMYM